MKQLTCITTALVVAAAGGFAASTPALGRTASPDKTQVMPSKKDLTPASDSVGMPADTTQRAHDRNRASEPAMAKARTAWRKVSSGEVLDWAAIDRNKDHLIEPEEMEAALKH